MTRNGENITGRAATNKPPHTAGEYVEGILRGDHTLLSRAITLIESTKPSHQALAQEILDGCLPGKSATGHLPSSIRIGITGAPGVGKSTFIETLGTYLTGKGHKVAVLAVDPTSQITKGSILGDKTRMIRLSADANAFIRPSPAGDSLGGVATRTRETMLLCEAAGFEVVMVETVGVGQSEVAVHDMVDFFLLLLLPGAGDELQGIKRGIVEMADLLAVNKADGERLELAQAAKREYARSLHLFPPKENGWTPKAVTCSAMTGEGVKEIWASVLDFEKSTKESGWFEKNRREQARKWLHEFIGERLRKLFYNHPLIVERMPEIERQVVNGEISPSGAAGSLLQIFQGK